MTPKRPRDPNQLAKSIIDIAKGHRTRASFRRPNDALCDWDCDRADADVSIKHVPAFVWSIERAAAGKGGAWPMIPPI